MSDEFDGLYHALTALSEEMKDSPAASALIKDFRDHRVSESDAVHHMAAMVKEDPDLEQSLSRAFDRIPEPEMLLFRPRKGLPQINPLVDAAIIERAQFDGDVPEHRTGPLPAGMLPAVPVVTKARNPVALGRMLSTAATEVRDRMDRHEARRLEAVAGSRGASMLPLVAKHGELVAQDPDVQMALARYGNAETDLPEYRRGQVSAPVQTATPSGSELLVMSKEEQREASWKALSTTQGRRSATPVVNSLVQSALVKMGFQLVDAVPTTDAVSEHQWVVDLSSGSSLQPMFSYMDVAGKALAIGLVRELKNRNPRPVILQVTNLDQLADRRVGWAARLYEIPA